MMWTVHSAHAGPILFGAISPVEWQLAALVGGTLAVVVLGCWVIYTARRWRQELADETPMARHEMLDHYQQMVDDGELDPQEFAQIKAQLEKPPAPAAPSTQPPATPKPPPDSSIIEK